MDFFILSRDSISMPETEEKKKAMKPKRKSEKKKTKKSKKEEPKETAKVPQFRVLRANTSGQQLAVELARQQFAAVQQERDKAERDKREEQQRQKQYMDELKAEAEKQKRAAEKFSKAYESTSLNVLDLYRSLSKDPESFKKEQDKLVENTNRFRDVLTSVGMNPDVAQIKATEASLQDLLERRQERTNTQKKVNEAIKRTLYLDMVREGWSEEEATQLSEILNRRTDRTNPLSTMHQIQEIQELRAVLEKAYKNRGWTPDEIETKVRMIGGGQVFDQMNFIKPTEKNMVEQGVKSEHKKPKMEEKEDYPSPLPSGGTGPPPLMEEEAPAPFPPPAPAQAQEQELVPYGPQDEILKELDQFWANRKDTETDFSKQVKEALRSAPSELSPISKEGSDYWTRVITDGSISTARLPPEEKEEGTIIPYQENALLAGLKRTLRGDKEPRPVEEQPVRRYPRVDQTIPPAPFPPIPPYQPPQWKPPPYKEPPYKAPSYFDDLAEGLTLYDPSTSPSEYSRNELVIYKPKEKLITPHEETSVKKSRVDAGSVLQQLPPAFGGGGGGGGDGAPPLVFE